MTRQRGVFEPTGWAMLRSPLLPAAESDALTRSDVRLALEIASETLTGGLERSASSPSGPGSVRAEARQDRAIRSYLTRMRYRATPFGMCAGVSLVRWGPETDVAAASASLAPKAQADLGWLGEAIRLLEGDDRVRRRLRWVANPAAVEQDGRIYLSERATGPLPRPGVSVQAGPAAVAVLALARRPVPYQALVESVLERPSATVPRAEGLINELCRQSFLLCELWTVVHDPQPLAALLRLLEHPDVAAEAGLLVDGLRRQAVMVAAFEAAPTVGTYRQAVASAQLMVPRESRDGTAGRPTFRAAQELQVDGVRELGGATVYRAVAAAAADAADLLLRFSPMPYGPVHLAAWRREFVRRYGANAVVPVPVAVDPVLGIGPPVQGSRGQAMPLPGPAGGWARRDGLLRRLAVNAMRDGSTVVELDDALVDGLTTWHPDDSPAPDDVDVIVGVAADSAAAIDRGEFTCVVASAVGAPGAGKVSGRFAHLLGRPAWADPGTAPGDRRAEVLFRPASDRLLNVALRPDGTRPVIPVGVPPRATAAEVIRPADILVCVDDERLHLVTRDGRAVIPVATHMLTWSRIPKLALFLLDVPRDGRPVLSKLSWGSAASLPVLPRLQRGRVVLSTARWLCDSAEVASEKDFGRWLDRWAPPSVCYLADGDNRLLVDLDDPGDREEILDRLVRKRRSVQLEEALPGPSDAWLPGPDGPRLAELAIPLRRRPVPPSGRQQAQTVEGPASVTIRQHRSWARQDREAATGAPGTEWLYLKLYLPYAAANAALARDVAPLLRRIDEDGLADSWFFIRYHDPAHHLRLRWRQAAAASPVLGQVVLAWAHELQRSGRAVRFATDRYEREVARYGGAEAMDLAERLFDADSRFVLALLELEDRRTVAGGDAVAGGDGAFADRTELAALTLHRLVTDLGVGGAAGPPFYQELAGSSATRLAAGRAYRSRQRRLREVIGGIGTDPEVEELLAARSAVATAVGAELGRVESGLAEPLESIQQSFAHLHLNRLLGPDRSSEQVIYGLLERTSRSLAASPLG